MKNVFLAGKFFDMVKVQRFPFNAFEVNTFVLHDESCECVVIDAGMQDQSENNEIVAYIEGNSLKPVMLLNTHTHIDHILGNAFLAEKYNLPLAAHRDAEKMMTNAGAYAMTFGIVLPKVKKIDLFLEDSEKIEFGNSTLETLYTPGHADGSVCFYSAKDNFVTTGDVLFNQSIGRTDLPTGDYDLLQKSIWEKLFTLPDETVVYPGHGPETTIGFEKVNNPFVAIGT